MKAAPAPLLLGLGAVLFLGCSANPAVRRADPPLAESASPSASASVAPGPQLGAPTRPRRFDVTIARHAVQHLAGEIGPRHATSPAFMEAAEWVTARFEQAGLRVRLQRVETPGGVSWGVPVEAGASLNVIAATPDYVPDEPHLVVGAHLDTVPQAPGAEDNASGVGVLLGVAQAIQDRETRLPVVLVAFGAEEPRGEGDANHHYGSRAYVESLTPGEREAVRGMISLDRVGVGSVVPVGSADEGRDRPADAVARAAKQAGVPVVRELNRSSDHWSFARAGLPGVRLGSTPYAGYHSAGDVPEVVDDRQLRCVGRIVLAWLSN
ncbi:MAG: M28 family peptidase [Nocardioides sp.]|nr:M28 family peptidase [Nocardioides sp.]